MKAEPSADWKKPTHVVRVLMADGSAAFYSGHDNPGDAHALAAEMNKRAQDVSDASVPMQVQRATAQSNEKFVQKFRYEVRPRPTVQPWNHTGVLDDSLQNDATTRQEAPS